MAIEDISLHPSLQELAYRALRDAIVRHELQPGARLLESELAQQLSISRSPIREALRRLQQDGLVNVRPREGVYVASITPEEADDIFRVRGALEETAARLAAERATEEEIAKMEEMAASMGSAVASGGYDEAIEAADEFHRAITAAARSPRLAHLVSQIYTHVSRFRNITIRAEGRGIDAATGHLELVEAIRSRNPDKSGAMMHRHIDEARLILLDLLQSGRFPTEDEWVSREE